MTVAACQDDTLAFHETMDITAVPNEQLTSTPLPVLEREASGTSDKKSEKHESAVSKEKLQWAIEVCLQKSGTQNARM